MQKIQCVLKDGLLSRISCGDETKLVVTLLISALSALSLCCHLPSGSSSSDSSLKKIFRYNSNGIMDYTCSLATQSVLHVDFVVGGDT